jgi:CheY-like chemotaxis protein
MERTISVLVVEDDSETRAAVSDALRERGYDVLPAADGREALNLLRAGARPSVILLDLMMPLNGWQFRVEQMKEADLARIPVIVMTAAETYWGVPEGAAALLRKPFNLQTLFAEIDRVTT